ncbi:nucleotidyltransferase family protein [Methylobacterium nodulans]|uniref:Nucleotidyltransferase-like domain-containing protein n=1 Tax=Methylobacterium nodulans (strain LMG 21967 / CNCM I-2342 / ORS 2060) TaxID=460265 RepID=B8IY04_METNO|nr:GSU2403 family nucleotidyltransferase fold protein [Methylobacterium nodulans]ACL63294.1 conserved hypothetical protein [Methylobacterium nodulans ORS 2060]
MAQPVSLALQTLYAELVERAAIAQLQTDFSVEGSFYTSTIKGRRYWYFQEPQREHERRKRYVGPDTPDLRKVIDAHKEAKDDFRQRREMIAALLRAGFVRPDSMTGRVLEALANAGVFRMRAVVVGTVAYQCYSGLLGVKLGASNLTTADLDLAQFPSISVAVEDRTDQPFGEILKSVDPNFRPVPHVSNSTRITQYALGTKYRVDILAPNRGPDTDEPVPLPALRGDGQPLRFLDFLLYQEIRAVALHGAGVLINAPAPERYALHKLIVSRERLGSPESQAKALKDMRQAAELIDVLTKQRPYELKDAWSEVMSRGPKWRTNARQAAHLLPESSYKRLVDCVGSLDEH